MTEFHSDKVADPDRSMEKMRFHNFQKDGTRSDLAKYMELTIGKKSIWKLFKYELLTLLLSNLQGIMGFYMRQKLYPFMSLRMGKGVLIGSGVSLRQPMKIYLDNACVIDDLSRLSVLGGEQAGIRLGKHVFVGRGTVLSARGGCLELADYANIGSYCRIASNARIAIGQYSLVGAYSYIGGGNHGSVRLDIPMALQKAESHHGVVIGDDVWIGAHCTILDGVTIGKGSIIGAMSLVNHDIPEYSVAYGSPAKVRKKRSE